MKNNKKADMILAYIKTYIKEHQYPPSIREICDGVGLKSTSSVQYYLELMFENGMIETDAEPGSPRCIRVPGYEFVEVQQTSENDSKEDKPENTDK